MLVRGVVIAILVAIADQLAKWGIVDYFTAHPEAARHVTVTGFFNLVLTLNRGISFGMFNDPPYRRDRVRGAGTRHRGGAVDLAAAR